VSAAPVGAGPIVVQKKDGTAFTEDELRRMQEEEELKGNVVRETAPGSVVILPKAMSGTPEAPAAPPAR
jgi:hypothetical protein